jgi:ABC-2 type transport system permease protein
MNAAATETSESFAAPATAPRPVRPFYWSVKRELWENRSLIVAPLVVAGIALLILIYRALAAPHDVQALGEIRPELQGQIVTAVYGVLAWAVSIVMNITVFFYLLDSLQGERKDRSVLFWKSMPVSDTMTVAAKLFTALVVSGVIVAAVSIATQLAVLLLVSVIMLIGGASPASIWADSQLLQMSVAIIYWQGALALWYAPVAAWLLLVSAWAKRVTILWALLTPVAVVVFERVAIGTRYVKDIIDVRLDDPVLERFLEHQRGAAFTFGTEGVDAQGFKLPGRVLDGIDPVGFFSNPWLWVGLVVAAGLVAAAIWMRRYREPL